MRKLNKHLQRLYPAFKFMRENAGWVVGEKAQGALALAKAEEWASVVGLEYVISPEPYPDDSFVDTWDAKAEAEWRSQDHECVQVTLYVPCPIHGTDCKHAFALASLGGIFDPSFGYMRVTKAELALEARAEVKRLCGYVPATLSVIAARAGVN